MLPLFVNESPDMQDEKEITIYDIAKHLNISATTKEEGVRIAADIAFAGFNNDPISKIIEPNLTTVNYSGYDMGEATVISLINHLNGITNVKTTNTIILRSALLARESSLKNKSL